MTKNDLLEKFARNGYKDLDWLRKKPKHFLEQRIQEDETLKIIEEQAEKAGKNRRA